MTELPSNWGAVSLGEAMAECRNGLTYRNKPELLGMPVSRIESISKGEIDFEKVGYGGLTLEGNQKHLLRPGDILFSHINSMHHVGKIALYKNGMPALLHGMNLLRITPSQDFIPEYLFYLLQSSDVRKQIWSKAKHAVNQASINIGELRTVSIPKPPLPEQHKIVEVLEDHLSRLAAALADVKQAKEKAAQFRRSLLQAAFTGNLTSDVTRIFTEKPNNWRMLTLGDVAHWTSGGTPSSKDNSLYGGEIPWVVIGDLTESLVRVTEKSLTQKGLDSSSAKICPAGTVMLAMYGASIGRTGMMEVAMCTNQAIACGLVNDEIMTKEFLLYFLQSQKELFIGAGKGGAQPNISQGVVKSWQIFVPPLSEQHKIVEVLEDHLSRLDASVALADSMEKQSATFRRALLQAAFTGQLTKEVASV